MGAATVAGAKPGLKSPLWERNGPRIQALLRGEAETRSPKEVRMLEALASKRKAGPRAPEKVERLAREFAEGEVLEASRNPKLLKKAAGGGKR